MTDLEKFVYAAAFVAEVNRATIINERNRDVAAQYGAAFLVDVKTGREIAEQAHAAAAIAADLYREGLRR